MCRYQVVNAMNGRYRNTNGYLRTWRVYTSGSVASAVQAAITVAGSRWPRSHALTGRHIRRVSLIEIRLSTETIVCEIATSTQNCFELIGSYRLSSPIPPSTIRWAKPNWAQIRAY